MSQNLTELLELLVEDLYGDLASTVFAILARHGRLSIKSLTDSSGLPLRLLKHGLVILIQQHLAFHYTEERDGITYYEADIDGAYALVRSGKALDIIREKFGETAALLTSSLCFLGHASVKEIAESISVGAGANGGILEEPSQSEGRGLSNGSGVDHSVAAPGQSVGFADAHTALYELKKAGLLEAVTVKTFLSQADIEADAVSIARSAMPDRKAPRGKKDKEKHDKIVNSLKRRWRESETDDFDEESGPSKKQKTNGMSNGVNGIHGHHFDGMKLRDDLILKPNHEKIKVLIRIQRLADLAARVVGEASSHVYKFFLETLAERQPRCFSDTFDPGGDDDDSEVDEELEPIVTCAEVLDRLPPGFDLSRGLALDRQPQVNGTNGPKEDDAHDDDMGQMAEPPFIPLHHRSSDERHRVLQIAQHLDVLAASTCSFLRRVGNAGHGQYKVKFSSLCARLIQLEIEDTVTSRFGNEAARLVRILAKKGKLDEKQLSVLSLIRPREVKGLLLELQQTGFMDLQEVPRDAGRVPSRTIYLYFFDRDRVRRKVLDDTYKIMARILQRSKVERDKMRLLIEKAERTDVQGNEDKYLTAAERNELERWKGREARLLIALGRCDDTVAILRDFLPDHEERRLHSEGA